MIAAKPKLLVVGAFPPKGSLVFGGIATVCRAMLSSSFRDAFNLVLVDSTQISNPPPGLVKRAQLSFVRFACYCYTVVRERPDGILLFAAIGASLIEKAAMAMVARIVGIPVALFPRGGAVMDTVTERKKGSRFYVAALKTGDRFFCQGQKWHQFALSELGYVPAHAPVIENWSASSQLLAIGAARRAGASTPSKPPRLRVLFVGWLEREKGVGDLLAACRALAPRFDFELVIAGDGRFAADAKQFVRDNDLGDRVVFKGWVEPHDVPSLLAEADIFVLPSHAEGLPNALIEAMAAAVPAVVTTVGAIPQVITNGENGLLVAPHDVEALGTALSTLFKDGALRTRLGANAHYTAAASFSLEPAMKKLTDELNKMIADAWSASTTGK